MTSLSKNLRIIGIILMGLYALYFLFLGVGKMIGGDPAGLNHWLPAAIVVGMTVVAWKRPAIAGMLLLGIGMVATIYFFTILADKKSLSMLFMVWIPLIAGVVLLSAGLIKKPAI